MVFSLVEYASKKHSVYLSMTMTVGVTVNFTVKISPLESLGGGARRSKPVTKLVDATVCKWNVSFQMILSFLNSALLSFVMLQHLAFYFYNFVFFVRFVKLLKNSTKRSTLSPYLFTFVWYVLYDERCLCCPHSILPSWASMLVLFILKMRKWPLRISPFCRLMTV